MKKKIQMILGMFTELNDKEIKWGEAYTDNMRELHEKARELWSEISANESIHLALTMDHRNPRSTLLNTFSVLLKGSLLSGLRDRWEMEVEDVDTCVQPAACSELPISPPTLNEVKGEVCKLRMLWLGAVLLMPCVTMHLRSWIQ